VRGILREHFSQYAWARRLHGGRWEEWWADPCDAYVWLWEPKYLVGEKRPCGCAIYDRAPAPRRIECYPERSRSATGGKGEKGGES